MNSDQNEITIRLKLVPYLALYKIVGDQSKTVWLKSDQNKVTIRLKLVPSLTLYKENRSK